MSLITNLREGFVAGVYACSAAMIIENISSRDFSEAAYRIEIKK